MVVNAAQNVLKSIVGFSKLGLLITDGSCIGSLYLSRVTGGPISEAEAREILAGRGDLENLWHASQTDKEMYRLPDGIWVQFAFFQDCRDAQMVSPSCSHYDPLLTRSRSSRTAKSTVLNISRTRKTFEVETLVLCTIRLRPGLQLQLVVDGMVQLDTAPMISRTEGRSLLAICPWPSATLICTTFSHLSVVSDLPRSFQGRQRAVS